MQHDQFTQLSVLRAKLLQLLSENRVSLRQMWWYLDSLVTPDQLLTPLPKKVGLALTPILTHIGGDERKIDRYKLMDFIYRKKPCFVFVVPSWNNQNYVNRNLSSVVNQDYWNYRILYINDQSSDNTLVQVQECVESYHLQYCCRVITTAERNRQGASRFLAYHLCDDDEVLVMLDGDDWLTSPQSLSVVAQEYLKGALVTYGSYQRFQNGALSSFVYGNNEVFPPSVVQNRSFRNYRWISQHLRTGYAGLFKRIRYSDLVDKDNCFLQKCTDLCEMMPVLEMAGDLIHHIRKPICVYNVDASYQHPNSWFRMKGNQVQGQIYRDAMSQIKNTTKYASISFHQIVQGRNLRASLQLSNLDSDFDADYLYTPQTGIQETMVKYLAHILDACQLPMLGIHLPINNPRIIYAQGVHVGFLREIPSTGSILLLARNHTNKNVQGLVGHLVVSVKVPPDPSGQLFRDLHSLFGSCNAKINLK